MIRFTQGNLLDAAADALVNTVNEVGVMGKGIALMFKEGYPESAKAYEAAAKRGEIKVGSVFLTATGNLQGPRWVVHFPTKKHWRHPSRLEWIREGLIDLVRVIRDQDIRSIAIPPLGCGNGGLDWDVVRREIVSAMSSIGDVDVQVFEPTTTYQNAPKRSGVNELTPARALMAEIVRRYSILGLGCSNLEVQKLAWFLQRSVLRLGIANPLQLEFAPNKYGPYADNLRHLLNQLDGSFLHCERRLADAGPLDAIEFDESKRNELDRYFADVQNRAHSEALEMTAKLIDGFESPLGMELLATVDWLLHQNHAAPTVEGLRAALSVWPGGRDAARRKLRLFDDRLLKLALDRLEPVNSIRRKIES